MKDILSHVFTFIQEGSNYKSICLTSTLWCTLIKQVHPIAHLKFSNYLLTLLKMFPDKDWSWYSLSENTNITWQLVTANPGKDWSWYSLSYNPNITWEIVNVNLDKPWNWISLSKNSFGKAK